MTPIDPKSPVDSTSTDPMNTPWHRAIATGIVDPEQLPARLGVNLKAARSVCRRYPMRVTPTLVAAIEHVGDPIGRQFIPRESELHCRGGSADPLSEVPQSPVAGLVHRYPGRALLMVTRQCAVYCRHCMRKRWVGQWSDADAPDLSNALAYIARTPAINEVILSGGDPLILSDAAVADLLGKLRAIRHVRMLRIHTRVPGVLPERITPSLTRVLSRFVPLYINIQFNHPREITPAAAEACGRLADAGIPLGSQTVLLRHINDNETVLADLMDDLVAIRVRPYYLHHPDPVAGTAHFRVAVEHGLSLMDALRGRCSGMAIPHYMIDLPGGHGKIPMTHAHIVHRTEKDLTVRSPDGRHHTYPAGENLD